jgi:hypothetical protein
MKGRKEGRRRLKILEKQKRSRWHASLSLLFPTASRT